jgi:hypothetical protein
MSRKTSAKKREYLCPECEKYVHPKKGTVSDPTFVPDLGFCYSELTCPVCTTILASSRLKSKEIPQ